MLWMDHLLVLILVFVLPIVGFYGMKKLRQKIAQGYSITITNEYWSNILIQWSLIMSLTALWIIQDRPFGHLGLTLPNLWAGSVSLAVLISIYPYLTITIKRLSKDTHYFDLTLKKLTPLSVLLPKTVSQRNTFYLLSITAGICEETLYRGFMFVYLGNFFNLFTVVVLSSILFGLAHAYQGWLGGMQTGLIGIVMALIYITTDSLWACIVLHCAIDVTSGTISWYVLHQSSVTHANQSGETVDFIQK